MSQGIQDGSKVIGGVMSNISDLNNDMAIKVRSLVFGIYQSTWLRQHRVVGVVVGITITNQSQFRGACMYR